METLTLPDTQRLHHSIQKIYALHDATTFGLDALIIINQLVPGDIPCFHSTNIQTRQVSSFFQADFPGLTPAMEEAVHKYYGEHPIVQHMPKTLNGAYKISDFIDNQQFHSLEGLYQQYLGLFDIEDQMIFFLSDTESRPDANSNQISFSLHRSQRNFTERDRQILNIIRPHLSQAYINAQHCQRLEHELNQSQQCLDRLGVIVLNSEGRIQSIATRATIWLETYFTKSLSPTRLPDHLWSWVKHQIKSLSHPVDRLPKAVPALRMQQADQELTIRLVLDKDADRYLLLLEERLLSSAHSLDILGLSQRETELLNWVMQGADNKTIADQMGITVSTVRKHLENLYRKLGVTHRSEAIAEVLRKLGLLPVTMMR